MTPTRLHPDWLVPDWPAPEGVHAVCTTRAGGCSSGVFDSLNLGDHVGDQPLAVQANRGILARALQARPVFLKQVHGSHVLTLNAVQPDDCTADAAVSLAPGLACTVMVADCLPVLLAHQSGSVVGAAHAGWRGLAGQGGIGYSGVLEATLGQLAESLNLKLHQAAPDILAWLGPCIGPSVFEVGSEVKAAFEAQNADATLCFVPTGPGKYLADLPALARLRLQALGVSQIYGNDGSPAWCTVTQASRFFSHRRVAGAAGAAPGATGGRFAACIWRD